jgi:hypothetical protein
MSIHVAFLLFQREPRSCGKGTHMETKSNMN